jgi:hypothetical protein
MVDIYSLCSQLVNVNKTENDRALALRAPLYRVEAFC